MLAQELQDNPVILFCILISFFLMRRYKKGITNTR